MKIRIPETLYVSLNLGAGRYRSTSLMRRVVTRTTAIFKRCLVQCVDVRNHCITQ